MKSYTVSLRPALLLVATAALFMTTTNAYSQEVLAGWSEGIKADKVVFAVNSGSKDSLVDAYGITYQPVSTSSTLANYPYHIIICGLIIRNYKQQKIQNIYLHSYFIQDDNFNGGVAADEGGNQRWLLPNSDIYHTERYGPGESFKYLIPVQKDGTYALILKFSEIFFQQPGEKVFNVKIGNKVVLKDFDIFAKLLSKSLPYDAFFEIEVKNKKVYLDVIIYSLYN